MILALLVIANCLFKKLMFYSFNIEMKTCNIYFKTTSSIGKISAPKNHVCHCVQDREYEE